MLAQAGLFLLDTLTGFFSAALLLRFYMQAFRVSFRNQVASFIVQVTNWLVMPLRRVLPGVFGLDLSCLLPAYLLQALLLFAVFSLRGRPGRGGRRRPADADCLAGGSGDPAPLRLSADRRADPPGRPLVGERLLSALCAPGPADPAPSSIRSGASFRPSRRSTSRR